MLLDPSAEVAGHLAVAVRTYVDSSRRGYRQTPPELEGFIDAMSARAMRRQDATPLADLWEAQHRDHVTPKLLTIAQAARLLACSTRTVQRRITSGDLPAVHCGQLVRIRATDLDDYLSNLR